MEFTDTIQVAQDSVRRTADGYLAATARVARGGNVQRYTGAEMGVDKPYVDVYRPEDEVFSDATMSSFASRPLTNNHPTESVTADNWREYSVGYSGEGVARDGDYIRVQLLMTDSAAIADYENGKRELSMGYTSDIKWQDGTTSDGQHFDAIQTSIRNNHIALVDKARAGHKARIGDRRAPSTTVPKQKEGVMPDLKTVVVDGLTVESTASGVEAINKVQKQLDDAQAQATETQSTHDKAIADKDAEIAKRDAIIDELNEQVMTDEQLDAAVKERADLVGKAKLVADEDYSGMSPDEIRKAAVKAKLGDAAIADKSPAYVEARFDVLQEQADSADPVRSTMSNKDTATDDAQAAYERKLQDGYQEASNA